MKKFAFWCKTCGARYENESPFRCRCGAPLDLSYQGWGIVPAGRDMASRYGACFPFEPSEWGSLGAGMTPLTSVADLAGELGLSKLWVKNESANPTWSFKDRGTAACLAHARALGYRRIGTVSSGNMAASVAAFGASAGMETVILVKGNVADEKMAPVAIYGARLIRVDGPYDGLYSESLRLGAERGIYFMNSDAPMRVAGSRTIAYEIAEDLDFQTPDWVIVPTSAGGNIRGIINGFAELKRQGLINRLPGIVCAQAANCSPIVKAFDDGSLEISRFPALDTLAHAIDNPFPPSGNRVLEELRAHRWPAVAVGEEDIVKAQAAMARQGLFGQPASCVPLAALRVLCRRGIIQEGQSAVLIMTGSGLKYTAAFTRHHLSWEDCRLEDLPSLL